MPVVGMGGIVEVRHDGRQLARERPEGRLGEIEAAADRAGIVRVGDDAVGAPELHLDRLAAEKPLRHVGVEGRVLG